MFEKFTDRARKVVVLAQEESRMLNHNYIGTEHLLLGLIHEGEGVAAKALDALGVSLETVRQRVEEIIGRGKEAPSGHIPFTPRTKKVLELALKESVQLGHHYIGTEHILLGMIREGEGVAAQVLQELGADLNRVRQQVIQLLRGHQREGPKMAAASSFPPPPAFLTSAARLAERLEAIERRLAAIERHLGVPEEPARPETGGGPRAGAAQEAGAEAGSAGESRPEGAGPEDETGSGAAAQP